MKYKIAYIDEQDTWINTFYQTFKYDFEIEKIKIDGQISIDELIKSLFEYELDGIVTDYLLEEEGEVAFNGNAIVEEIRKRKPHFPIIMLTAHESQAINFMDDVHIIYGKDILDGESEEALALFRTKIKSSIANYYSKIANNQKRIEELVEKRNQKGLELHEEEELTKLFILQDELEPEGKDIPSNLIQREAITKLNDFVSQAKDILEELKQANKK